MSARLATLRDINATGTQVFIQSVTWIFFHASSNFAITTTFAVDPIGVIFHQNHTPNTRAHQSKLVPYTPLLSKYNIIGIIAMVIGILSTTDESIAVHQSTIRAVSSIFFSTPQEISSAKNCSTQADSNPHTNTKRDTKNKNTESSSFLRYFCGLSCGATSRRIEAAPKSATTEAGILKI